MGNSRKIFHDFFLAKNIRALDSIIFAQETMGLKRLLLGKMEKDTLFHTVKTNKCKYRKIAIKFIQISPINY